MAGTKVDTAAFNDVLTQALADLKDVEQAAKDAVVNRYAPRLAGLVTSDDPAGEFNDLKENAELELEEIGIDAETDASLLIQKILVTAAGVAIKFI